MQLVHKFNALNCKKVLLISENEKYAKTCQQTCGFQSFVLRVRKSIEKDVESCMVPAMCTV